MSGPNSIFSNSEDVERALAQNSAWEAVGLPGSLSGRPDIQPAGAPQNRTAARRFVSLGQENGTRESMIGSRGGAQLRVPEGWSGRPVCVFSNLNLQAGLAVHGIQNSCGGRMLAADEIGEVPAAPVRRPWKPGKGLW